MSERRVHTHIATQMIVSLYARQLHVLVPLLPISTCRLCYQSIQFPVCVFLFFLYLFIFADAGIGMQLFEGWKKKTSSASVQTTNSMVDVHPSSLELMVSVSMTGIRTGDSAIHQYTVLVQAS